MAAFTLAFSDIDPTISMTHTAEPIDRDAFRRAAGVGEPERNFFRGRTKVVHDAHRGITPTAWYATVAEAVAEGCRPCRVCRP